MKPFKVSEDIVPFGGFKAQASRVFRKVRETRRSVVITQNGRPAAVLVSPDEFDRLRERDRFMQSVQAGMDDADSDRVYTPVELQRILDKPASSKKKR